MRKLHWRAWSFLWESSNWVSHLRPPKLDLVKNLDLPDKLLARFSCRTDSKTLCQTCCLSCRIVEEMAEVRVVLVLRCHLSLLQHPSVRGQFSVPLSSS